MAIVTLAFSDKGKKTGYYGAFNWYSFRFQDGKPVEYTVTVIPASGLWRGVERRAGYGDSAFNYS
jgi:hypothetical protein